MSSVRDLPAATDAPDTAPVPLAALRRYPVVGGSDSAPAGGSRYGSRDADRLRIRAGSRSSPFGVCRGDARGLGSQRERGDCQPAVRGSRRRRRAGNANARLAVSGCDLPRRLLPVEQRSLWLSSGRGGVSACRDRRVARSAELTRHHHSHLCAAGGGQARRPPDRPPGGARAGGQRMGRLVLRGYSVRAEADGPRCASGRDTAITQLEPVARIPARTAWEQKIDAILRYPSQLETVFQQYVGVGTTREEISQALSAYATQAGDGTEAERFWRLSEAPASAGS